MEISSLSPIGAIKLVSDKQSKTTSSPMSSDVFIKKSFFRGFDKPLEDGKSFDDFIKWAEETDFINKSNEILSTGHVLGAGFEGRTIEIPDCDKWVIKEYQRAHLLNERIKGPEIKEIKDILPELNAGQFVASVKLPLGENCCEHFYILKKQEGTSYGVPYEERFTVTNSTVKMHLDSLSALANMPQKTFEKLVDDIQYVTQKGYKFDVGNPYNFMIDVKNQSVNFVDIADKTTNKDTQFGDVLFALLDGDFATSFRKSSRPEKEKELAYKYSKQICSKFLMSMIRRQYQFTETNNFLKVMNNPSFEDCIGAKTPDDKLDIMIKLGLY